MDELVLNFLETFVKVNYTEGQETADAFGKLERKWIDHCVKQSLKPEARDVFGKTIQKILERSKVESVKKQLIEVTEEEHTVDQTEAITEAFPQIKEIRAVATPFTR